MNLIVATILFTCCFFAAANGFPECGERTSCVKLLECPHYSKQYMKFRKTMGKDVRYDNFLNNDLRTATCGLDGKISKVCCENPISCGNTQMPGDKFVDLTVNLDQFPWNALLTYQTARGQEFGCAGVLISDRHVLTSAQCANPLDRKLVSVRLGEYNLQTARDCVKNPNLSSCTANAIDVDIERNIYHENYSPFRGSSDVSPMKYNIAVLKLVSSVDPNDIQPICLPEPVPVASQEKLTFYTEGWGTSTYDFGPKTYLKRMSSLKLVDKTACKESYGGDSQENYICARSELPSRSCVADLGGALIGRNSLSKMSVVGIYSSEPGVNLTNCGEPSTFIDVRKHLDWIQQRMLY